jgi:PST family polysaccharide transporter
MAVGRATLLALGLVTTAILTRVLGPAGFGYYRAAVAYLTLAILTVDLGLGSVFVREISRPAADQPRTVGSALVLRLLLSSVAMALAVGLAFLLGFEPPALRGILGGSVGFVAYSVHLMLFGLFQQKLRQQGVVFAEVVGGLVLLAGILVLADLGSEPFEFVVLLGASYALSLVLSLIFAHRLVPFTLGADFAIWRSLVRSAAPLAATGVLTVLYVKADTVLLSLLSAPEVVGLYGVPVKISDSGLGLALLFIGLVAPLLARHAHADPADFSRWLENGMLALATGIAGFSLMLNAVAPEIVLLIGGPGFAGAVGVVRILSLFLVLHSLSLLLREALIAKAMQGRLVGPYAAGAAAALAAYVPLILYFGGSGAAAALVVAEVTVLGLLAARVRSDMGVASVFAPLASVGVSAVAGVLSLCGSEVLGAPWWITLSVTASVYVASLLLTRAVALPTLVAIVRGVLPGS